MSEYTRKYENSGWAFYLGGKKISDILAELERLEAGNILSDDEIQRLRHQLKSSQDLSQGRFDRLAALKEENERLTSEGLEVVVQLVECKARVADYEEALAENAALKEENERLMRLHADTCIKAGDEITTLKARVAELEAREVDAIANKICGHLPKGYYIKLCLEKEAGWVELDSPDVATDRDDFEGGIYSQLLCALEVAEELSKEPANEG